MTCGKEFCKIPGIVAVLSLEDNGSADWTMTSSQTYTDGLSSEHAAL